MFPKPGIVRVKGKAMKALRIAVFLRDKGRCTACSRRLALEENEDSWSTEYPVMHLAHIRGKRNNGDTLENTRARCPRCHLVNDHNPKSVPPKKEVTQ